MNRIKDLFREKQKDILSIYFTAGYPSRDSTANIIKTLAGSGADLVEIGIPFSDPLADGPTIQESNDLALQNGMSVALLFEQLKDIRSCTQIPLILMGYLNPVLQYGLEAFCSTAADCGIDGLIIPDLPLQEYRQEYKNTFDRYGLKLIFLITPQTSADRIRLIDQETDRFIYLVTSHAVTGAQKNFSDKQIQYLERVQDMQLHNPVLAGFGISTKTNFRTVNRYVNGAIIGSGFIRALKEGAEDTEAAIQSFIQSILS